MKMNFKFTVTKSNPVMDAQLQAGDMFIQEKDANDRKIYLATEILGDLKLVNINSAQAYNKDGYAGMSRQQVIDILTEHFYKFKWTFIPVEQIAGKDVTINIKA
jgi:hypothetical protein